MLLENALYGVFAISAGISLLISLLYKIFMDQEEIKEVKEKMNELKEKSEEAKEKGKEEEASKHMQEMMKHSSKQFKMQLKPMAVTFLVIIPLFWFVFPSLYSNATVDFNETDTLKYKGIEKPISLESQKPLKVSIDGELYEKDDFLNLNSYTFHLEEKGEKKIKLERVAAKLPFSAPFVGNSLGWLGWYILVAIGLGQVFRKLMGAMP